MDYVKVESEECTQTAPPQRRRRRRMKTLRRRFEPHYHLMLLPGVILTLIFCYVPMAGIVIAFQNFKPAFGMFGKQSWTVDNFTFLFTNADVWRILGNTVIISFFKMVAGLICPVVTAIMLSSLRVRRLSKAVQIMIYLPHFISWVLVGYMLKQMLALNGPFNSVLVSLGIDPVYFLGNEKLFRTIVVLSDQWKEFGYGSIVYFAAILAIDESLYEAAKIDGANKFRQIWHVTLPGIRAMIFLMAMLGLGNILSGGFEQIYNLISNPVKSTGEILDTYIYDLAFKKPYNYSLSAAVGLVKSAVGLVLTSTVYFFSYKFANYTLF